MKVSVILCARKLSIMSYGIRTYIRTFHKSYFSIHILIWRSKMFKSKHLKIIWKIYSGNRKYSNYVPILYNTVDKLENSTTNITFLLI